MRMSALFTALLFLVAAPAVAATIPPGASTFDGRIQAQGGSNNQQIYDIDGDRLGLVRLRRIESGDFVSRAIIDQFTSANVLAIYAGRGLANRDASLSEFDNISDGYQLFRNGVQNRAIWVLWNGSQDAIFEYTRVRRNGRVITRTSTLEGANPTLAGQPNIDIPAVPVPASGFFLAFSMAGVAWVSNRRRRGVATF
ncbi:MAG: hypothetical protein AAGF30_12065 [Pseudomonadota bacterium]